MEKGSAKMRSPLQFERVDSQEKLERWKAFAESFDHGTGDMHPMLPITTVSRDGQMFAYWNEFRFPVLFPSWHPRFTSPREFADTVEAFSNIMSYSSMSPQWPNGVAHVGLATHGLPVARSHVLKLGYEDLGVSLYRRLP